ncbi:hypothetical protein BDV98DRAFT_559347 [Pterulicium gracile]|uniref:Uncharacterized protein n=1 Tax=Pterulicium gracile TaxID=1884261 RepID=A0A5C3QWM7_9AGAR|nr:hypothetical protein BDV98DRAFT_559347 [Pterula gracilis]
MSSSFPSSSFLQHPAFSSDPSSNPFGINWQSNPSYAKSTSSSSDSGHSSAHSSYTSSSSTSSSGSDMPSLSVLPNPTLAMKKKKKQPQLSEAPSSKVANPVMSHPPLTRSRSSLFRQKGNPLDRIDELDETSMAGLLHHQGPYEAAKKISNQHRLPPGLNVERHIDEHNSKYLSAELDEDSEDETIPRRRAAKAAKKSFKSRHSKQSPQQTGTVPSIGQPLGLVPGQIVPRGLLESYQLNPNAPAPQMTPGQPVNWNYPQADAARHFSNARPSPSPVAPVESWTSLPPTSPSPGPFPGASHPSVSRLRRRTSTESLSSDSSTPTTSSHSRSSRDSQSQRPQVPPRHRGRHHHGPPARNLAPRHVAENMRQQQFVMQVSMINGIPTTPTLEDILVPTTPRTNQPAPLPRSSGPLPSQPIPPSPGFSQSHFPGREQAPFPGANPLERQGMNGQFDGLTRNMEDLSLAKPPADLAARVSTFQSAQQEKVDKYASKHGAAYGIGEPVIEAPPPYSDRGIPYRDSLKSEKQPVILNPPPRWGRDHGGANDWNRAPGPIPSPVSFIQYPERHTPSPALAPSSSGIGEDTFNPYQDSVYSPQSRGPRDLPAPIGSRPRGSPQVSQSSSANSSGFFVPVSDTSSAASLLTSNSSHSALNNSRPRPHYLPKKLVMPAPLQHEVQQLRPLSSPDVNPGLHGPMMGQGGGRFSAPAMPSGLPSSFQHHPPAHQLSQPMDSYLQPSHHALSNDAFRNHEAAFHAEHHGRKVLKKKNASTSSPVADWGMDLVNANKSSSSFSKSSSSLDLSQQRLSPPSAAKEAAKSKRLSKKRVDI